MDDTVLPIYESPDEAPSTALARTTDPATSHDAAASVDATELEQRVLDVLRFRGSATTEQLAVRLGLSLVTVSPRLKPLEAKGLVRRAGKSANRSGRQATVWERVP